MLSQVSDGGVDPAALRSLFNRMGLEDVIERLGDEHETIAEILDRLGF